MKNNNFVKKETKVVDCQHRVTIADSQKRHWQYTDPYFVSPYGTIAKDRTPGIVKAANFYERCMRG